MNSQFALNCPQLYRLTDPAPTYGNQNFSYMLDFLTYESPKRATLYHPETGLFSMSESCDVLFVH